MIFASLAAAFLQPAPVPLSLHEAQTLSAEELAARLLEGVEHRPIVDKSVKTDAYGKLSHLWLTEVGRASGPAQCARTSHRLKFDKGQLFARSLDHALALGTDCEKPPRWIRLQSGATSEIGAKLLKELTAAQTRLRKGEPSGLAIDCVDDTRRGLCAPDLDWQFGTMAISRLGAIEGSANREGYRFRAWWPKDPVSGVAWNLYYRPLRDAPDRLLMHAYFPVPGPPPAPPPPGAAR